MHFTLFNDLTEEIGSFKTFLKSHIVPLLSWWHHERQLSRPFFALLGNNGKQSRKRVASHAIHPLK
jgi:hypothetical protein